MKVLPNGSFSSSLDEVGPNFAPFEFRESLELKVRPNESSLGGLDDTWSKLYFV